jgi:phosphoribosylformimino-5-aminoimidazole carboxamide ribotide isomerase
MKIIPAIDIIEGKCVRLIKGDFGKKKIYNENPLEVAKMFESYGLKYLHLVDLDGAKEKHIVNYKILNEIASKTSLKIDFGGGIKSENDLNIAFENGAKKITAGSVAVHNPDLVIKWINDYGSSKIILGADCIKGKIAISGWVEKTEITVIDFIREYKELGIENVICTDISKDGMLNGVANELYENILKKININLIASGGVSSIEDIIELKHIGCESVIIGKAIYENKISLKELNQIC